MKEELEMSRYLPWNTKMGNFNPPTEDTFQVVLRNFWAFGVNLFGVYREQLTNTKLYILAEAARLRRASTTPVLWRQIPTTLVLWWRFHGNNSGRYHDAETVHASSHCFWHGESNAYTRSDRMYSFWLYWISQQKVGTCKQALADTDKAACRNCELMNRLHVNSQKLTIATFLNVADLPSPGMHLRPCEPVHGKGNPTANSINLW